MAFEKWCFAHLCQTD